MLHLRDKVLQDRISNITNKEIGLRMPVRKKLVEEIWNIRFGHVGYIRGIRNQGQTDSGYQEPFSLIKNGTDPLSEALAGCG